MRVNLRSPRMTATGIFRSHEDSILHTFGLEDRLVLSYEEFEQKRDALMMAPDYENVHSRLAERREECLQWLRGQLS